MKPPLFMLNPTSVALYVSKAKETTTFYHGFLKKKLPNVI
jgi:hypothetical protein